MKSKTCCFSGHRPQYLPWGYDEKGIRFFFFKCLLERKIKKAVRLGYVHFICGMAMGIDMLCAEIVLKLKKRNKNITLECALPCLNQTEKWDFLNIERYKIILNKSDKITYVSKCGYYKGCMQKRNLYMIQNSDILIAVFGGQSGGTKQTVELAKRYNLKIVIVRI